MSVGIVLGERVKGVNILLSPWEGKIREAEILSDREGFGLLLALHYKVFRSQIVRVVILSDIV